MLPLCKASGNVFDGVTATSTNGRVAHWPKSHPIIHARPQISRNAYTQMANPAVRITRTITAGLTLIPRICACIHPARLPPVACDP